MRLIDIADFSDSLTNCETVSEVLTKLSKQPTIDAVPVVRCRECVSRGNSSNFPAMIYCKRLYCYKSPEGYCDEVQRKEAAHE